MYVAVKGGETAIAHVARSAGRRAPRRPRRARALAGADRRAARARRRSRDDRGLLLRPRAGRARHQAGARRPDRGDLPAARLSHDAAALRRHAADRHRDAWSPSGASPPPSRTSRAARCWARLSTTPIACSTSRWPPRRARRSPRRPAPVDSAQTLPRVGDILEREGLLEPPPAGRGGAVETSRASRWPCRPSRPLRLQNLARGDEGFLLALGYSTQRGYGNNHPFVGEIRFGRWRSRSFPRSWASPSRSPRSRHRVRHGQPVRGLARRAAAVHPRLRPGLRPRRAQGDGHGAGRPRAARRGALGERHSPAQDEEFVLAHSDNVEARASCSTSSCRTMSTSSPSW